MSHRNWDENGQLGSAPGHSPPQSGGLELNRQRGLRNLVLTIDGLLTVASMAIAALMHAGLRVLIPQLREPPSFDQYAVLPYLVLPLYLGLIAFFELNRVFERIWTKAELAWALLKLHLSVLVALSVLIFLTHSVINRSLLLGFVFCTFVLLFTSHASFARWGRFQHESGQGRARLLLIGALSPELIGFLGSARKHPLPPVFVGRLGPEGHLDETTQLPPHLGDLHALPQVLQDEAIDQVLFFPPFHLPTAAGTALQCCEELGIPARFNIPLPQPYAAPAQVIALHELPFLSFEVFPKRPEAVALKHGLDAVAALGLLVLSAPLLLGIALGVLVTMGRPIFFVQERAGLFGRRFRMFKFRTMVADAEQKRDTVQFLNDLTGPTFKAERDPRITPFGRLLRRTSLDELPQLFNVLAGTMSLVGPRPLPSREQRDIHGWHRRRLSMKPGITGLWQVSGRSDIDFDQWMELDLEYIDRWSILLDLSILVRTVPAVLFGRGAH
jgi:exopolysaccharide biosynthesis polyprenyl glycosylphosphotransferase